MLPEDVIFDILTRLPAKSVGRFRCVSKPWWALLTKTHFIKAHLNRNKQCPDDDSLILVSIASNDLYSAYFSSAQQLSDEIPVYATELNIAVHPDVWTEGVPSCDGLILVKDEVEKIFVVNPTTRIIKELPASPFTLDPSASSTMYALGYDSTSDDYKVVTLTASYNERRFCTKMFVSVCSTKNGTWEQANNYDNSLGRIVSTRSGVYVSGNIHWISRRTSDYAAVIVSFDLAEEVFREVPPPSCISRFDFYHLVVLGGCLCMFPSSWGETVAWVMKEYGVAESWTKFSISDHGGAEFRPVCMFGQEQEEVMLVQDEDTFDEKLVMYNLKQQTSKNMVVHGVTGEFRVGGTFRESIISPYC